MEASGWYPTELLAWIQNQDPKKFVAIFFLTGQLIRILTFPFFPLIFNLNSAILLLKELLPTLKLGTSLFRPCSDEMRTTSKPKQVLEF